MDVVVALNERLACTPDGSLWGESSFGYSTVERYLAVFDRVKLVARIRDVKSVDCQRQRIDGPRMEVVRVPYFVGPAQYLLKANSVKRALKSAVDPGSAVILRMPSWHTTGILATRLQRRGYPYAVEVCGDAYDRLAPGASRHPLRPLFRWWLPRRTQKDCWRATAALFVTNQALQRRYPAAPSAYSVGCSDVSLADTAFSSGPRRFGAQHQPRRLIFVGSLSQPYKAPDVLVRAVARCCQSGLPIQLRMIGAGSLQTSLEQLAKQLGVSDQVRMLGQLKAGDRIRNELDDADLFVLPSRQEGLPRAMVEAMARGLPCIGSTVGGIPELLADEDMVSPGDVTALANKITDVVRDPMRLCHMAARNWKRAHEYHTRVLDERRRAFYEVIRQRTEEFLAENAPPRRFAPAASWKEAA